MLKPFLSIDEQITNLINNKHLVINDLTYASETLRDIRYFSLIDGYKTLFYNPMNRCYVNGTTFDEIVSLYKFDENLRFLFFRYIEHIEQRFRSQISYYFCQKYSPSSTAYTNIENYNVTVKNKKSIEKLIDILEYQLSKNNGHNYINYYREKYNDVPLYVIVNTITLGQISKMYSFLKPDIQSKISKEYENVNEKEISQYLKVLTDFRNICAHGERLYISHSHTSIPDTVLHKKLKIETRGEQYICGKNDLFAVVIAFRYLLRKDDFNAFKRILVNTINCFAKESSTVSYEALYSAMGFPSNWKKITQYKK